MHQGHNAPETRFLTRLAASLPTTTPFVGPEALSRARGGGALLRLGANESAFGPSPKAVAAIAAAAAETWMYGDPEAAELTAAVAAHLGVEPRNVKLGEGVDGLLGLLCRLTVDDGAVAVMPAGGYPTFAYHVRGFGGWVATVPYADAHTATPRADLDAMLEAARQHDAKLVYLANPDNPTGGALPPDEIGAFADALPEGALLALDEAYAECAGETPPPPLTPIRENVVRFRSFSKAYGLAGLRVGYAVGATGLVQAFDRVRNHFGLGRAAQAGAAAALADQSYLRDALARMAASKARIGAIAGAHGLAALPSATNFVLIDMGGDGEHARAALGRLLERDVFVRMPAVAPLDRCIRVSCAPDPMLDRFAERFAEVVSS